MTIKAKVKSFLNLWEFQQFKFEGKISMLTNSWKFLTKIWRLEGHIDIEVQDHQFFNFVQYLYLIKTQFHFEDKIQNGSKVIKITRNHTNIWNLLGTYIHMLKGITSLSFIRCNWFFVFYEPRNVVGQYFSLIYDV